MLLLMYWCIAGAYCTADRYRTARILRRLTAALCDIRCAGPAPASGNRPVAVPWGKDAVAADTVPRLQCVAVGAEAAGLAGSRCAGAPARNSRAADTDQNRAGLHPAPPDHCCSASCPARVQAVRDRAVETTRRRCCRSGSCGAAVPTGCAVRQNVPDRTVRRIGMPRRNTCGDQA